MSLQHGAFVISLDFELYWGMRDETRLDAYKANLAGVRQAIPMMLENFSRYGIHATWAIVGFIFFQDTHDLLQHLPTLKPDYRDIRLDPYRHLPDTDKNPSLIPYYYAPELVEMVRDYAGQEIASHSFSHYYPDEPGSSLKSFSADLDAAKEIAKRYCINFETYVFPRQQYTSQYIEILAKNGIRSFRGDARSGFYHCPEKHDGFYTLKRGMRLIDSAFNLTGHQSFTPGIYKTPNHALINIPASRFFYPHCPCPALNQLRLERIMRGMTHAARKNEVFHLWWHPHNFGAHTLENIQRLERVLEHYHSLQARYGMQSMSMQELAKTYPIPVIRQASNATTINCPQHTCETNWTSI
ncbi:polysaccharide deacetylase [Candidatus Thiothrix sp. Deng01]|uniref:Polysaccharide deacetylase n=1 Tax=Candidatus Thiothrix phosphatis TaxID=3112415 RepID=A0ABU6CZN5_9GAMM|nr:hypothetical protein [Candidatus Thiothrix sp. Deng01]MEB4592290.1 polysaccharide deacetylase [Candidatus Thiothrix sp. Deng01]